MRAVIDTARPVDVRLAEAAAAQPDMFLDPLCAGRAGRYYARMRNFDLAVRLYKRFLALDGERYAFIYRAVAMVYEQLLRDPGKAVRILQTCTERCHLYSERDAVRDQIIAQKKRYGFSRFSDRQSQADDGVLVVYSSRVEMISARRAGWRLARAGCRGHLI